MKKKSSINFINVDKIKNNIFEKLIYSLFYMKEILLEGKSKIDHNFYINKDELTKFWGTENSWSFLSPIRVACDAYLLKFLKDNFPQKEISILEVGCGRGKYAGMIENLGYKINYLGIDGKKNGDWLKFKKSNVNFLECYLGNNNKNQLNQIKYRIPNVDLILSQSCLEHIKYDVSALNELHSLFPNSQHLHFVPSPNSFLNYFTHGYRRYTHSSLKKIGRILNKNASIIPLGNNLTLKQFFSWFYFINKKKHPYDFFSFYKKEYLINKETNKIIFSKKKHYPVFYSLNLK